jgi:hypothetical protein
MLSFSMLSEVVLGFPRHGLSYYPMLLKPGHGHTTGQFSYPSLKISRKDATRRTH